MQNASARPIFRKNTFVVFSNQISSHERATTFCQRIIKSHLYVFNSSCTTYYSFFFFFQKNRRESKEIKRILIFKRTEKSKKKKKECHWLGKKLQQLIMREVNHIGNKIITGMMSEYVRQSDKQKCWRYLTRSKSGLNWRWVQALPTLFPRKSRRQRLNLIRTRASHRKGILLAERRRRRRRPQRARLYSTLELCGVHSQFHSSLVIH